MERPAHATHSKLNHANVTNGPETDLNGEIQRQRLSDAFRVFRYSALSFLSHWNFPAAYSADDAYQNACIKMLRRFANSDLVIGEAPSYQIVSLSLTSRNVKFSTYFYTVLRSAANDIMRNGSARAETMDFTTGSAWISPRTQDLSRATFADPMPQGPLAARKLIRIDDKREQDDQASVAQVEATLATVLASADLRRDAGPSTSAIALLLAQIAFNPELQEYFAPEAGTKAIVDAVRSMLPSLYGDAAEGAILRAINRSRERLRGLLDAQPEIGR